ncbi:MAG: serine hydrolase [Bacteroidetes bacterium]|nr:serine hydrolase [Bacteroidota bacterium]
MKNHLLLIAIQFVIFSNVHIYAQNYDHSDQTLDNITNVMIPDISNHQKSNPIYNETICNNSVFGHSASLVFDTILCQQLQEVLDDAIIDYGIKGLSAALSNEEGEIWAGVSGISHDTVQITTDMLFGVGSQTKNFIATIILQLYEEGQLNLSDSIYHWLPVFENIDTTITIKQLLNHTSGVYDWLDHPDIADSVWVTGSRIWTPEEILSYFILNPLFPAGTNFSYSNSNYLLLGLIIEAITGNDIVDELHTRLLQPLGLNSSCLFPDESFVGTRSHVWGPYGGPLIDYTDIIDTVFFSASWCCGNIFSTAEDLVKWSKGLYQGSLLNDTIIDLMITPTPFGGNWYGLGTQLWWSGAFVGHSGDVGYTSETVYNSEHSLSIAVLSNTQSYYTDDIRLSLYYTYLNYITNINQPVSDLNISIYPNPCKDQINVVYDLENAWNIDCEIIDIRGEVLCRAKLGSSVAKYETLDMSSFPAGVYFIRLEYSKGNLMKKIIKAN